MVSLQFFIFTLVCSLSIPVLAYTKAKVFENESSQLKALVFLSASCPCSQSHINHLNRLKKVYPNFKLYGVISDEFNSSNQNLINQYYVNDRFSFPLIKDTKQQLVKSYNALKTPHVVLFKKKPNGKYTKIYEGGISDQRQFSKSKDKFLEENLVAFNSGKPLPYANGRSLGCYIRRF